VIEALQTKQPWYLHPAALGLAAGAAGLDGWHLHSVLTDQTDSDCLDPGGVIKELHELRPSSDQ
jgi:hypothetical protein